MKDWVRPCVGETWRQRRGPSYADREIGERVVIEKVDPFRTYYWRRGRVRSRKTMDFLYTLERAPEDLPSRIEADAAPREAQ